MDFQEGIPKAQSLLEKMAKGMALAMTTALAMAMGMAMGMAMALGTALAMGLGMAMATMLGHHPEQRTFSDRIRPTCLSM